MRRNWRGVSEEMETTQRRRPWLAALKGAEHERATPEVAARDSAQTPYLQGVKSAKTLDVEAVAWRVAAMRPQIPPRGPIPLLYARQEAKGPRAPDRCGS
jgi:hypothetical protein